MSLHEKALYAVPLVPSGSLEQPLSIALNEVAVGVAVGAADVADADADVLEAFSAASLAVASFARFASTPVPAASPMTAADSSAMMQDRMKTSVLHPHITPLDLFVDGSVMACWEYVEAAAVYGDVTGAVAAYVEPSV